MRSEFPKLGHRRGGFSFVEVLFAVILLGIGFIMIAGIFPVAIQQSTTTAAETSGAAVGRDAIRTIQSIADQQGANAVFPVSISATGGLPVIVPFTYSANAATNYPAIAAPSTVNNVLGAINPASFLTSDRRYSWVGFYRRNNATDSYAQVWVIVLKNDLFADTSYANYGKPPPIPPSNFAIFAPPAVAPVPSPLPPIPSYFRAELRVNSSGVGFIQLADTSNISGMVPPASATAGAFVLVSQDPGNTVDTPNRPAGTLIGRVLRLGSASPQSSGLFPMVNSPNIAATFQLEPGFDLKDISEQTASNSSNFSAAVQVYIIGAAPDSTGTLFTGPNQDITVMSGMIRINTAAN